MREILRTKPYYKNTPQLFKLEPYLGTSGIGINIVRHIRNKFAHGTLRIPAPYYSSEEVVLDAKLIELSTRITLHTIQMLLLAYLRGNYFTVDNYRYNQDLEDPEEQEIDYLLRSLHLQRDIINDYQLPLFTVN